MNYFKKSLILFVTIFSLAAVSLMASAPGLQNYAQEMSQLKTAQHLITMEAEVPSPDYALKIQQVWIVDQEVWVIGSLDKVSNRYESRDHSMVTPVQVKDSVVVGHFPNRFPTHYFLVNNTENVGWKPESIDKRVKIIDNMQTLQGKLVDAKLLWERK